MNQLKDVHDAAANEVDAKVRLERLEKQYHKDISMVWVEHPFLQPEQLLAPTPETLDGTKPTDKIIRLRATLFDSLEIRKLADDYLYKLIVPSGQLACDSHDSSHAATCATAEREDPQEQCNTKCPHGGALNPNCPPSYMPKLCTRVI